jgi:hypothetical protein
MTVTKTTTVEAAAKLLHDAIGAGRLPAEPPAEVLARIAAMIAGTRLPANRNDPGAGQGRRRRAEVEP